MSFNLHVDFPARNIINRKNEKYEWECKLYNGNIISAGRCKILQREKRCVECKYSRKGKNFKQPKILSSKKDEFANKVAICAFTISEKDYGLDRRDSCPLMYSRHQTECVHARIYGREEGCNGTRVCHHGFGLK